MTGRVVAREPTDEEDEDVDRGGDVFEDDADDDVEDDDSDEDEKISDAPLASDMKHGSEVQTASPHDSGSPRIGQMVGSAPTMSPADVEVRPAYGSN